MSVLAALSLILSVSFHLDVWKSMLPSSDSEDWSSEMLFSSIFLFIQTTCSNRWNTRDSTFGPLDFFLRLPFFRCRHELQARAWRILLWELCCQLREKPRRIRGSGPCFPWPFFIALFAETLFVPLLCAPMLRRSRKKEQISNEKWKHPFFSFEVFELLKGNFHAPLSQKNG